MIYDRLKLKRIVCVMLHTGTEKNAYFNTK